MHFAKTEYIVMYGTYIITIHQLKHLFADNSFKVDIVKCI